MMPLLARLNQTISQELDDMLPSSGVGPLGQYLIFLKPSKRYYPPLLEAPQRKASETSRYVKGKGLYPPPVYCAKLKSGEIVRMSFYSQRGKPLDFDSGRRTVAMACRNAKLDQPNQTGWLYMALPARIKQGWVDMEGEIYPDPFFDKYKPGQEMLRTGK